jgi:hypothetical protein
MAGSVSVLASTLPAGCPTADELVESEQQSQALPGDPPMTQPESAPVPRRNPPPANEELIGQLPGDESIEDTSDPTDLDEPVASNPWADNVTLIMLDAAGAAQLDGDLANGAPVSDLSWAWTSNVACFTPAQGEFFEGNQVFYALAVRQPAGSILTITVTPDEDVEVSLYGYQTGTAGGYPVPPDVSRVNPCESSQASTISGPDPGEPESIEFHNPTSNEYNTFFAVCGDAVTGFAGGYTISVELIDAY